MAGIVKHHPQCHPLVGPAHGVQRSPRLAAMDATDHQPVDDHLGAVQLI
jgi:hypothetical protein